MLRFLKVRYYNYFEIIVNTNEHAVSFLSLGQIGSSQHLDCCLSPTVFMIKYYIIWRQNMHTQVAHYKSLYHVQWFYVATEESLRGVLPVSVLDPLLISQLQVPGGSFRVLNKVVLKDLQRKK